MLASRPFHFDLMLQAPGEDRLGSQGALRSCSLAVLSHGLHPAALQHSHSLQTRGMAGPEEDQCPFPTPACLISLRLCLSGSLHLCVSVFLCLHLSPLLPLPSPPASPLSLSLVLAVLHSGLLLQVLPPGLSLPPSLSPSPLCVSLPSSLFSSSSSLSVF